MADPDETLLETYQAFLNRQGFDTCVVTTGESCLAALTTFAPDVLVLEPELAGSWGIRILSYLREQRKTLPAVIVLTRHEEDLSGFTVHAHHLKPYSMHDLAHGIRQAAEKRSDATTAKPTNASCRVPRHSVP